MFRFRKRLDSKTIGRPMGHLAEAARVGFILMGLAACSANDAGSTAESAPTGVGGSATPPSRGNESGASVAGSPGALSDASSGTISHDSAVPHDAQSTSDAPVHVVRPCAGLADAGAGQWENITPLPDGIVPMSSTIDATGTVWVGAYARSSTFPSSGGLFKSTDCGASWTHVNTGTNGAEIDRSAIWSMAIDLDAGKEPTIYVIGMTGPNGLLKSTNGGVDWVQLLPPDDMVSHVVPAGPGNPPIASIASISIDPTNHQHLIVGVHVACADPYGPVCDIESTDAGQSWKIVKVPVVGATGWQEQTGPYVLDATTWIHATLANGIWLTTNDGASWSNVAPKGIAGATGGEYTMHAFRPSSSGNYYLPSSGPSGLLRSSGIGQPWTAMANAPAGNYNIAFATGGGHLFVGDGYGATLHTAEERDPTKWSMLPLPPMHDTNWGVWYLDYDETNHVLYALIQKPWAWSSMWRIVIP